MESELVQTCTRCHVLKPWSAFHIDKRSHKPYSECKECRNKRDKNRKAAKTRRSGHYETPMPGDRFVERKCMRCRKPFRTAQDYRMCPGCRSGNVTYPGYMALP